MATTAAELIAKIGVVGGAQFRSEMQNAHRSVTRLADGATSAGGRVLNVFSRFTSVMSASAGAIAGLAGGAGVLALGAAAIKASADWEQLGVTLESLTGSAEKARSKLQFIRDLAIPATATTEQLARAGVELESFGVRMERALPVAAKLQAAFQFDPESLEKATRLIGRLAQSDFPDIELMSGLGLNKGQFAQQGIKFDPQGRFLSTAREALDALDRIVNQKYGSILEKVAGTTNAKLATLQDRWQEVMRQIGRILEKEVMPYVERFTNALDRMSKSGELQKWVRGVVQAFKHVGSLIAGFGSLTLLTLALIQIAFKQYTQAIVLGFGSLAVLLGGMALQKQIDKIMKEMNAADQGTKGVPGIPKDNAPEEGWGALTDPLSQIAANTRLTAENTRPAPDLRRIALGGGPLGQMGVTPVEFAGFRNARGREIVIRLEGGGTLERMVAERINEALRLQKANWQL